MRSLTLWIALSGAVVAGAAADGLWTEITGAARASRLSVPPDPTRVTPTAFRLFSLDAAVLENLLAGAPRERLGQTPALITLPRPDGSLARFEFVESPIMAPALAARFPTIRTFLGQGTDEPAASVRFDSTPAGFHAQVLAPSGSWCIDPWDDGGGHAVYRRRDLDLRGRTFECLTEGDAAAPRAPVLSRAGDQLRTYRLAMACTGEYAQFHGGTAVLALAAMVTTVNRVVGIYEIEVAVRMELVANNDQLVYLDGASDPYTNSDGSAMLFQNQSNVDSVIGSANYDVGHVVSTGGGGVAFLGVVCSASLKAAGVTGSSSPVGDSFDVDYVAHELGHQFGGNHTFNSTNGSCCCGNRNSSTAYEPGSASTIMGYAGICGADDLQSNSDAYFHSVSFDEIRAHVEGSANSCAVITATGNTVPTVDAGGDHTIPRDTPFTLTGAATDPDVGQTLTHCWEQRDLGPAVALSDSDNGQSPLFRTRSPTTSPSRTFPQWSTILSNTSDNTEKLPSLSRDMDFRLTVRDNAAGGGGVNTDDMVVTVHGGSGPFRVTAPNGGGSLSGSTTVTWDVAGTSAAPVNTASVNILLSTDGGTTFATTLASATPNDGSETVTLPNVSTAQARVMVAAASNIHFDVSDADFTITPSSGQVAVTPASLDLGARDIGAGASAASNVTVSNAGVLTLNFVSPEVALSGTNASAFAFTPTPPLSPLTAGVNQAIAVTFDPAALGPHSANLVVTTDDTSQPSVAVPLSGTGTRDTPDLVEMLLGIQTMPALDQVDANRDGVFDGADVVSNLNAVNSP